MTSQRKITWWLVALGVVVNSYFFYQLVRIYGRPAASSQLEAINSPLEPHE